MKAIVQEEPLVTPIQKRDHIQGNPNAPLTLVHYGDFECPYSGEAFLVIKDLQEELRSNLRYVFRHFPLEHKHAHALVAAEAAEAAGAQGQFWEMYDVLFENPDALSEDHIAEHAAALGLDQTRLIREIEDQVYYDRVMQDVESGQESGVDGTPTLFINGFRYAGETDLDSMLGALREAAEA
jgi:protein-disulfide isomerase